MSNGIESAIGRLDRAVADVKAAAAGMGPAADPGEVGVDLSGLWDGKVMEKDTYQITAQLQQYGTRLAGSLIVWYDDDEEPYLACQRVEGTVDGEVVTVRATDVSFIPDDPDADYSLDVLELRLVNNGQELSGRWTDEDGDADGRAVLRRSPHS